MQTKKIKDLKAGDVVVLSEPTGLAKITSINRARLFGASGGCWAINMRIIDGPNKGKSLKDQHHVGNDVAEVKHCPENGK